MNNSIYIRRQNKVFVEQIKNPSEISNKRVLVGTVLKNLETYGYTLSKDVVDVLSVCSDNYIEHFYTSIIATIKELVGANREYVPMYPNFPTQVMEASDAELYINAIMHYFGDAIGLRIVPDYEKNERFPLYGEGKLTVIGLGTKDDYHNMFRNLMASKTSISDTDTSHLQEYFQTYGDNVKFSDVINHKEVLALVTTLVLKYTTLPADCVVKFYNNATDVLRLATVLSEGDVSLKNNTKFKTFSRRERRLIMALLDNAGKNIVEDMNRYRNRWIRLGERLHPKEFPMFKNACSAFDQIRSDKKIETFASNVEQQLEAGEYCKASAFLTQRPAELARRLDHLVRSETNSKYKKLIVQNFSQVVDNVSTTVLLQVLAHFKHRNDEDSNLRVIFPKGQVAKARVLPNELPPIDSKVCEDIVNICSTALIKKYAEYGDLGKVYIDPELNNYLVPFSQRSASKAKKTIVRGSKIPLGGTKSDTIRMFTYWHQHGGERIDIDLSVIMFDSNWKTKAQISYTCLRNNEIHAYHSGDITSAPNGAAEFIDISIQHLLNDGIRYVAMNLYAYSDINFSDMPECFAGWMIREKPQSGEIFEPKTVQNKYDLTSESRISIPIIVDLEEMQVVWADLALTSRVHYGGNNVHSNVATVNLMAQGITQLKKPTLFELFRLHGMGRGTIVKKPEDADVVFGVNEGNVTVSDLEKIMAEYL